MNLRFCFLFCILGIILLSVSLVSAEECVEIAGEPYCCSSTPDSVCPEDYEDAFGVRVSCDNLPNGDIDCKSECEDGIDNDQDGCVDVDDNDCDGLNDNSERGTQCDQGLTCQITEAYWANGDLSKPAGDLSASIGQYVFLVVKGNSYCDGESVSFSIDKQEDIADPSDPPSATFTSVGSEMRAVSYWKTTEESTYTFTADTSEDTRDSANDLIVSDITIILEALDISPSAANLHTPNGQIQYHVFAQYSNRFIDEVTYTSLTSYLSDTPSVVSIVSPGNVPSGGLATAEGTAGQTATITAKFPTGTLEEKSDTSLVTLVDGDTEWVEIIPTSASLEITDAEDLFSLYHYRNGVFIGTLDFEGSSVIFSVSNPYVAKVLDADVGLIEGLGMGTTSVRGTYTTLYDDAFLTVEPNGGGPYCGNGVVDPGETCESDADCPMDKHYCYNCACDSYELLQGCKRYTECTPEGIRKTTKICGNDIKETIGGSCTPLSTSVPFFGWIHVVITLGLLTGYYAWKKRT